MNLQPRAMTEAELERIYKRYSETSYAVCRDDLLALLRYVLWQGNRVHYLESYTGQLEDTLRAVLENTTPSRVGIDTFSQAIEVLGMNDGR